jgi:hypothetical protein
VIDDFLTGWRDITPAMRQRVRRVLKDWQQHARPFEDTTYWAKRFLPFVDVFAHTLPTRPLELFRAERTDIDNRYADRFTSWSRRPDNVEGFGWGQRRMVTAVFQPEDILVDFVNLDLDTEGFQEVIVRPGHYNIIPWRLGWDRTGAFNVYAQPERARAQGYTLGGAATLDPYRNSERDVADALEHVLDGVVGLDTWPKDACFTEQRGLMSLRKILAYDDYSSWGEWKYGELRSLRRDQLLDAFISFRGRAWAETATSWLSARRHYDNIPAIVLFDSDRYGTAIGDGRGRVSLAVGLGLSNLYAIRIVDC